ncbi:sensor histidine kinase [Acrocarpospora catenulata]|uniref:sensor histidine kinase n=1 Tax=Acrocarpospora catenulata TaxID=2836182 RepID=UPI001BDA8968|nr:HAMP domain-containing sensor histidine kinase [Acrocarpospora catenulata]
MSAWHRLSIRTRLTAVATAVMALICTVAAVFILMAGRQAAIDYRTGDLVAEAVNAARQMRGGMSPLLVEIPTHGSFQVFNSTGAVVATSPDIAGKPPMTTLRSDVDAYATTRSCHVPAIPGKCKIIVVNPFHRPDGVWQVDMAVPDVPWYVGPQLLIPLAAGWLLLVGTTAAGVFRTVGQTLAPVSAISGKLAQITSSDLSHRVPVPKYQDELRELAETANRTLDRAESAVVRQLRFASDASHDLRNPLTAMRTQIEEALMDPREADWALTAEKLLDSVERLQALVTDLLQIARLDAGATGHRETIDLTGLVAGELGRRPRRVPIFPRLTPGVLVDGDRIGLTRLLNNLLDNAERHAESAIDVTLALDSGTAVLAVCDDGEGVPPDKREVIFQRFTRLEASRRKDAGGTGLGLPIARQLAEGHGGTLTLEDSPRGARFVLRIPGRAVPTAEHDLRPRSEGTAPAT